MQLDRLFDILRVIVNHSELVVSPLLFGIILDNRLVNDNCRISLAAELLLSGEDIFLLERAEFAHVLDRFGDRLFAAFSLAEVLR